MARWCTPGPANRPPGNAPIAPWGPAGGSRGPWVRQGGMGQSAPTRIGTRLGRAADSGWVEVAGRFGLAARGVMYLVVGGLAARIALGGNESRPADKQGALQAVARTGLGRVALVVLAAGFAGFALWRFAQALQGDDPGPNRGRGQATDQARGWARRLGKVGQGLVYVAALATALSVLSGSGGGQGDQQGRTWTARVLGWPGGRLLVGAVGLVIVGAGLGLAAWGLGRRFEKQWRNGRMPPWLRTAAGAVGMAGFVARGLVFALLGLLLLKAAVVFDPNQAQGVDGTLRAIAAQPDGRVLLLAAAAGLAAFGLASFVDARYRKL